MAENNKYNNMVGLVLYSSNPFAIKKIHDIVDTMSGDELRKEIINTKYIYSTMTEVQQEVFNRLARGEFEVDRRSDARPPVPLSYETKVEYYHDTMNIFKREVIIPVNDNTKAWFVLDRKNNIAFLCKFSTITIEPNTVPREQSTIPTATFCDDFAISKLFYYTCEALSDKNSNKNRITLVQAQYELKDKLLEVYKRT